MELARFAAAAAAGVLVAFSVSGCSDGGVGGEERMDTYEVSGTITMGGAPLPDASVTFSPKDTSGDIPVATGRTNTKGEYVLTTYDAGDGAAAGEYVVLVSKSGGPAASGPDAMHEAYSGGQPPTQMHSPKEANETDSSTLPAKYSDRGQTPFEATVTEDGDNVFPFDIEP